MMTVTCQGRVWALGTSTIMGQFSHQGSNPDLLRRAGERPPRSTENETARWLVRDNKGVKEAVRIPNLIKYHTEVALEFA